MHEYMRQHAIRVAQNRAWQTLHRQAYVQKPINGKQYGLLVL